MKVYVSQLCINYRGVYYNFATSLDQLSELIAYVMNSLRHQLGKLSDFASNALKRDGVLQLGMLS